MKVKLLKKVRKRFDIIHHPNGVFIDNRHHDNNLFELIDNDKTYCWHLTYVELRYGDSTKRENYSESIKTFNSESDCINYLKTRIINQLKREGHRSCKDKKIINSSRKVWYNG